jgi:hypothetical protein
MVGRRGFKVDLNPSTLSRRGEQRREVGKRGEVV